MNWNQDFYSKLGLRFSCVKYLSPNIRISQHLLALGHYSEGFWVLSFLLTVKFTILWGGKQIRKSPSSSTKAGWGSRACALCSQDFKHTRFSPHHFCIIQWNLTNKRLSEVRWHLIWVVGNQWKRVSWREGNLSWADNLRWMCWGYLQCQFSQRWTELHFSC